MKQASQLHYILTVLCNCDVKRSHFSKIIKTARNIYLTLSIISFLYRSWIFFLCLHACTLKECSPITVKQLVLLMHRFAVNHKYPAF